MIPNVVERTLNILIKSLEKHQITQISFYLYGSISINGYIEGSSDIDFIAIVPHALADKQIEGVRASHLELETILPNTDIMGSYILQDDLGKDYEEIKCILTYSNKEFLINAGQPDINPITWWMLKHNGVHFSGPAVDMKYETDSATLLSYVHANMNSYWTDWIARLELEAGSLHLLDDEIVHKHLDYAVEWCVLGMLRQLYTVNEIAIKSKVEAGYYGLGLIPEQWHNLILEAISMKKLQAERRYSSAEARYQDLISLLKYISEEVNRIYDKKINAVK